MAQDVQPGESWREDSGEEQWPGLQVQERVMSLCNRKHTHPATTLGDLVQAEVRRGGTGQPAQGQRSEGSSWELGTQPGKGCPAREGVGHIKRC